MRAFLPGAALLCVLGACAGPRPSPPAAAAVAPPPAWRGVPAAVGGVDAAWWRTFGDPVLDRLVEAALAGNTDVAIAVCRVEEARGQVGLARADLLPRLDASGGALHQRDVGPFGTPREQTAAQPGIVASYELDLFGRLGDARDAARADLLASAYARDGARLAVEAAVVSGYVTLRALDARLEVVRATLADRAAALHLATRRADAGYSSKLEMRQAEAEYRATQQLFPQVRLAITRQEDTLDLLLGRNPGGIERGLRIDQLRLPEVAPGLPSAMLRRRPDIARAEQLLVASDRDLDAARAAFLPSVRLAGSGGAALSTLLADPVALWSIGGSVLVPLFEGGRLRARSDVAAARRDEAAFAYRRAALQAFRDVEDGLAAETGAKEQFLVLQEQRTALSQALRIASNRYRAGYAPYLDQLDAERGLLAVDLAVIQARSDRLLASVALFEALGGGWDDAARAGADPVP